MILLKDRLNQAVAKLWRMGFRASVSHHDGKIMAQSVQSGRWGKYSLSDIETLDEKEHSDE